MAIENTDSFHWLLRRIGLVSLFVLVVLNILTIVVAVIFAANTPAGGTNILAQIFLTLDAFVFWLMLVCMAISAILWVFAPDTRVYIRTALVWVAMLFGIGGLGWWLLRVLTGSDNGEPSA